MKLIWILALASSAFGIMENRTSSLPQREKEINKNNETALKEGVMSPLVPQTAKERNKEKEEAVNQTVRLPQIVKEKNIYNETTDSEKGAVNIKDIINSMDSIEQEIIDLGSIASGEQLRYRRTISNDVIFSNRVTNLRRLKRLVRLQYAGKKTKKFLNGPIKRQKKQTKRRAVCFSGQVEWKNGLCMPCSQYYEMSDGVVCSSKQFKEACFLKWHEECEIGY